MLQSWKEVLPGDHYRVQSAGLLHSTDQRVITCLYQPIIGIEAVSLYFTFWQETDDSEEFLTHHHLMGAMNVSLDRILTARKKLEAIGLLQTLKKKDVNPSQFLYRLEPPLTPDLFFKDGFLNLFLYRQVGPREYKKLSREFASSSFELNQYEDISVSFDDVFESMPTEESPDEMRAIQTKGSWQAREEARAIHFNNTFDFKKMNAFLSDAILSEDALTDEVKTSIEKLAFIYQVDPYDMSRALQSAALHTGTVDIEVLRKEVRDFYLLEHGADELPALYERAQPEQEREITNAPQNEEEQLIAWYEQHSPYQLLQALGQGSKPAAPDLRLIENLMFDTKLNPGVINVLIDYITKVNDHNLNKSFVEKVAAQWARANVRTVRQAMSYAREEQRKRAQIKTAPASGSVKKNYNNRKPNRNEHHEVIPEWMKNQKKQKNSPVANDEEVKQRAKWLEDYLNNI
ncbi:replication initiation and membrane attachment family protein [Sporolactobacillus kofuensis]|uniref:Replication initiation and membrane attachment family protein n=1 Tax=Sporolactobacillus kofuensis TaxID=269672 RepID=A0ABW1WCI7_9BACL|nr:DnaD domain protein [Sporolactobacillus kofuensis]MCO7175958.1 DnaD domain protein [Sporolactobacillus kofuensis]